MSKKVRATEPEFSKFITSRKVYNLLAQEGREELSRPNTALLWSGLVAGLAISFSLISETVLANYLPDNRAYYLVANFGYCIGFTIVILGRFQLFTENTISAVLPLLERRTFKTLRSTLRLWGLVFAANLAGTFLMAALLSFTDVISQDIRQTMNDVSHHAVDRPMASIFIQAIPAGFLVAAITWLLPNAQASKFAVLIMMTYLIAIGDFAHVIVGSCEVFVLLLQGELALSKGVGYILTAGLGNIIGGTFLFSLTAYAQVREEMEQIVEENINKPKPYRVSQNINT